MKFESLAERQAWGEDRVFFYDQNGELRAVPAAWTTLAAPDPFVVMAAGLSHFRTSDLLELVRIIAGLKDKA